MSADTDNRLARLRLRAGLSAAPDPRQRVLSNEALLQKARVRRGDGASPSNAELLLKNAGTEASDELEVLVRNGRNFRR